MKGLRSRYSDSLRAGRFEVRTPLLGVIFGASQDLIIRENLLLPLSPIFDLLLNVLVHIEIFKADHRGT
jgi:hypothetical protein